MSEKLIACLFLTLAGLSLLLAGVSAIALVRALTVGTTLAAIESAFGTFVLVIILLVAARKLYDAGLKRLKTGA